MFKVQRMGRLVGQFCAPIPRADGHFLQRRPPASAPPASSASPRLSLSLCARVSVCVCVHTVSRRTSPCQTPSTHTPARTAALPTKQPPWLYGTLPLCSSDFWSSSTPGEVSVRYDWIRTAPGLYLIYLFIFCTVVGGNKAAPDCFQCQDTTQKHSEKRVGMNGLHCV